MLKTRISFLSLVGVLFVPAAAMAYPHVGDTSIYDLNTVIRGSSIKGEYTITVTSIDRAADNFTQNVTVKMSGTTSRQTLTLKLSQYEKEVATRADRLQNCA